MYIDTWQLFLLSFATGILASIFIAVIIAAVLYNKWYKERKEAEDRSNQHELMTKLCFVLLVKGLITDSDRDWMMNKIEFDEWKRKIEDEINNNDKDWYM